MYNKIYEFCKIRNLGNCLSNIEGDPTPRVKFIMSLLDDNNIKYDLDEFIVNGKPFFNIVMTGSSNKFIVAHHDIVNKDSDNANDNSASVINAIMVKKLKPEINVAILDGEEFGGIGSQRLSDQINDGLYGSISWVLNLELSGSGGDKFFIGDYPGELTNKIKSLFDCPIFKTPFNDSTIFIKNGIDSCVINPLPITDSKTPIMYGDDYLDYSRLFLCHSIDDSVDKISIEDMKTFVEDVVIKILS